MPRTNRNIILIGVRCSGKTAVGLELAKHLQRPFVDTDALIREATGKTVEEIVAAGGWPSFREAERQVIAGLAERRGAVIALGGGAVLDPRNISVLRPHGFFVWLHADPDVLAARIEADTDCLAQRPSLTGQTPREEIAAVLEERRPLYQRIADLDLDTTDMVAHEAARRIDGALASYARDGFPGPDPATEND